MMGNLPDDFVFSQSSLQDYVDCPRRFELRYIQHQRYPAPEVDDLIEFERRMEQGQQFHHVVHQHLVGLPPNLLQQHIQDDEVRGWFETYLTNGLANVPEVHFPEQTLAVMLGDWQLLAKFDLVALGDKALIVDWKTSRKQPRRDWLENRLQTIVYRYVLAKGGAQLNKGQAIAPEQIEMRYWYANDGGTVVSFDYDADQFQADEATLHELVQEIDTRGDFPLTHETRRCAFCTYRSLCDRGREAGKLAEWETLDYENVDFETFEIDVDQIAEIEF